MQWLHPNRPWKRPEKPPTACAAVHELGPAAMAGKSETGGGVEFFSRLGPSWPLTDSQRRRLVPKVAAALAAGWDPQALAAFVGANTAGVRNPAAVLAARLSPAELPLGRVRR